MVSLTGIMLKVAQNIADTDSPGGLCVRTLLGIDELWCYLDQNETCLMVLTQRLQTTPEGKLGKEF